MEVFVRKLKRWLFPPLWVVVVLTLFSAASLTIVFLSGMEQTLPAYMIDTVSAYALTVFAVRAFALGKALKTWMDQNAHYQRYRRELDFRLSVSVHLSFAATALFALLKGMAGLYYRSAWLGSMAFYYLVLGTVRLILLEQVRARQSDASVIKRKYHLCGWLLLVLTFALGVIGVHTVYGGEIIRYPGFLIYGAAGFTFYTLSMAAVNLARCRRLHHPLWSASRILGLASALVSLFFLQNALLAEFGSAGSWEKWMNAGSGALIFAVIAAMAVHMIRFERQ